MEFVAIIVESVLTLAVGYAGWKFKKMRETEMENLGGNGGIESLYLRFLELPMLKDEEK